jgi:hypothetical protein
MERIEGLCRDDRGHPGEHDSAGPQQRHVQDRAVQQQHHARPDRTPKGGASCTLANVHGGLVYSDTIASPVADQGVAYLYFGGAQSVTAGSFTVVYDATNGIFSLTL